MARNPQVTKYKRQKFRQRRGWFKPLSEQSTMDGAFVDAKLRKFSSERIATESSVDRSQIPDDQRGYVAYRDHAKINPKQAWLDTIFPGVQVPRLHAAAIADKIAKMQAMDTEPTNHVVLDVTTTGRMLLFWASGQKCYWFVQQVFSVVRVSCTYGSPDTCKEIYFRYGANAIHWKKREQFTIKDT